jgi:glycosyltransferase involved in cell wall biosynthesis
LKRILFVANVDWFFISHRLCIAEKAKKLGFEVYVACLETGRSHEIKDRGIKFINFKFSRSGTSLLKELKTIYSFIKLYRDIRPDLVHHITLKPVIYGSVVSRLLSISTLNAISGLGYNFTEKRKSPVQKVMIGLMKFGFNQKNIATIFQNRDDYDEIYNLRVITEKNKIYMIKGSGVDLNQFAYNTPSNHFPLKILFPSRMLWDKGVKELKAVSQLLKKEYENKIQFILAGLADTDNKAGVSKVYLNEWQDGHYVKWIGYQKDMIEVYNNSHVVILPSYREGMPKTLIEACAIGRPIITTNAIGCRECVDEGVNGFKVPVRSTKELAYALKILILDKELREKMGNASREKAEKEFDQKAVVEKHLEIYNELINA